MYFRGCRFIDESFQRCSFLPCNCFQLVVNISDNIDFMYCVVTTVMLIFRSFLLNENGRNALKISKITVYNERYSPARIISEFVKLSIRATLEIIPM